MSQETKFPVGTMVELNNLASSTANNSSAKANTYNNTRRLGWSEWLGFHDKRLWHWLQLLLIPLMIVVFTVILQLQLRQTNHLHHENQIQQNEQQHLNNLRISQFEHEQAQLLAFNQWNETLLREYIKEMSEILKTEHSINETRTRNLMRIKTLIVLRQLNVNRKLFLLQFLFEWGLLNRQVRFSIDLKGADLSSVDFTRLTSSREPISFQLRNVNLRNASFVNLNLRDSDFSDSDLQNTNFSHTDLGYAQFIQTQLQLADFTHCQSFYQTDFSGANLTGALIDDMKNLSHVYSLQETILPNGTVVYEYFDRNLIVNSAEGNHSMNCASNLDTVSSHIRGWTKPDSDGLSLIDYFFFIDDITSGGKHPAAELGPVGDETGQGQCVFWGGRGINQNQTSISQVISLEQYSKWFQSQESADLKFYIRGSFGGIWSDYCQLIFTFLRKNGKQIGEPVTLGGPRKNENSTILEVQDKEHAFLGGDTSLIREITALQVNVIIRKSNFHHTYNFGFCGQFRFEIKKKIILNK